MAARINKVEEELLKWATPHQAQKLRMINTMGSISAAARELGINQSALSRTLDSVKKRASMQGYNPEFNMNNPVPDGYRVSGISSYYSQDGKLQGQWVKSSVDQEQRAKILRESIAAMAEDLPRIKPSKEKPKNTHKNLMACYPIGDLHVGMLSWPEETGEDWNLQIAEQIQCSAMAKLVDLSPPCEKATIINLGDWFHADNLEGVTTRSGHHLDTDGRYAKMARIGVKIMRQCIESALKKHSHVHVINVIGNHDDTSAMMLAICLSNIYEKEPRVTVDTTPSAFMYFRHGNVLVGCHHGHSTKPDKLPGVMASDRAKDWGESSHRYWWIGHVHHQSLKDYSGVTVESFRTLAARDAYAHWNGYRAPRDMKCIILHEKHGEVARHTVNPAMLDEENGKN